MQKLALLLASSLSCALSVEATERTPANVQVGPRPYSLVEVLPAGPLRERLDSRACRESAFRSTRFSIAHRGAPMLYPEHTRESYIAAARTGAGMIECDVTFTQDLQLVCRHAQDDLHRTTNILLVPALAAKCTKPFLPADVDTRGRRLRPASAECRSSDITLAEFKTLEGRMDRVNPDARTVQEYLAPDSPRGTLLSHAESIRLLRELGVTMIPELKRPVVPMPFRGFSRQDFARALVEAYRQEGVAPRDVWMQSFSLDDVLFWKASEADFGQQVIYLDDAKTAAELPSADDLRELAAQGVRIWAPPAWALLSFEGGRLVPSRTAREAKAAGLGLIAWTLERPVPATASVPPELREMAKAERTMEVLDVLGRGIGVKGVFSDWPGTVTYYANCMGL